MAANTAKGAENRNTRTITFKNEEHKKFYKTHPQKCRCQDVYHKALVYYLGIDRDTRVNIDRIYNFKTGCRGANKGTNKYFRVYAEVEKTEK